MPGGGMGGMYWSAARARSEPAPR